MYQQCDVIPDVTVVTWVEQNLFGKRTMKWVLPAVTVSLPTPAQRRATDRQVQRQAKEQVKHE
jgi:hypothetical protein